MVARALSYPSSNFVDLLTRPVGEVLVDCLPAIEPAAGRQALPDLAEARAQRAVERGVPVGARMGHHVRMELAPWLQRDQLSPGEGRCDALPIELPDGGREPLDRTRIVVLHQSVHR